MKWKGFCAMPSRLTTSIACAFVCLRLTQFRRAGTPEWGTAGGDAIVRPRSGGPENFGGKFIEAGLRAVLEDETEQRGQTTERADAAHTDGPSHRNPRFPFLRFCDGQRGQRLRSRYGSGAHRLAEKLRRESAGGCVGDVSRRDDHRCGSCAGRGVWYGDARRPRARLGTKSGSASRARGGSHFGGARRAPQRARLRKRRRRTAAVHISAWWSAAFQRRHVAFQFCLNGDEPGSASGSCRRTRTRRVDHRGQWPIATVGGLRRCDGVWA